MIVLRFEYINPIPRGAKVPIFAKVPLPTEWAELSGNGHEAGMKEHYFCIFVFGEGSLLLALGVP